MKRMHSRMGCVALTVVAALLLAGSAGAETVNLLSLQEGALAVVTPPTYGGWDAEAMLDDSPQSGWAGEQGNIRDNVFVFEMVETAVLERFEFDNTSVDAEGAGAKDVLVEVSTTSAQDGFSPVLQATLADRTDGQVFEAAQKIPGRWVRLTIRNNQGSPEWTELFSFKGFGERPPLTTPGNIMGTYDSDYGQFHVLQQGTALNGCYESNEGLLEGVIEGRVMKLTWHEGENQGPAVMVFARDGGSFRGFWWREGNARSQPSGGWNGKKSSNEVGSCEHWAGSVSGELEKKLSEEKRARLYGLLFDTNSADIRPESIPVLKEVLVLLNSHPDWRLTIEGHTDAVGSDEHNQVLSQQRAESVKAYLTAAGVDGGRLETVGFGESHPVDDNETELGRARNRRVELVRN